MKPAPFEFARPTSLDEALELLAVHENAKVLAGGQSLIPLLSMRLAVSSMLLDINGIDELAYVRSDEDGVRVGALARHADLERDVDAARVQPLLGQALRLVAHATIRNRGTTVGSIVHADAAAEMPMVLALLGGRVTVASRSGRRDIEAAEFYVGPMESALRHDEIAVEASFPRLRDGAGTAIDEVARRHGDYALCGVAALVEPEEGGGLTTSAGYLSVCEVPTVVDLTPALGAGLSDNAFEDATELALEHLDPEDDIHATSAYRRQLIRVLTRRVVSAAHAAAVSSAERSRP